MKHIIRKYTQFLFLTAIVAGCTKQKGFGPNYSGYNGGTVPVDVTNSIANRPDPTVTASVGGDSSITVTMSIPTVSGRTIKEITKVATSSSYAAIQSTGATGFYPTPAVPGAGTTVTFKTFLGVYHGVYPKETMTVNKELVNRFYFRITLDDGSIIYPTPVRVLVVN